MSRHARDTWLPFRAALEFGPVGVPTEEPTPRARLGVILPGVNSVVEPWYNEVLAPDIFLHATRMLLASEVTAEALQRMDHEEGMGAAKCLASCRPDAIAYCCTASSIVQGVEYDQHLQQELETATGRPCFTAVGAIIEAMKVLKIRRISIASPYSDAIDHAEKQFFEDAGFEVVATANLNISEAFELASPDMAQMYDLCERAWNDESDALLISCLNMNSQRITGLLEHHLGRPVITSTTATLWKLLRSAGLDDWIKGYGRLLADH